MKHKPLTLIGLNRIAAKYLQEITKKAKSPQEVIDKHSVVIADFLEFVWKNREPK